MQIIAEVKTHSPFGYTSKRSWKYLFNIASQIGDVVSIHTDSRWNGNYENLSLAKKINSNKLILAKGFHLTDGEINKAIDYGADYVLVVGRIPGVHEDKCLVEPNSIQQLIEFNYPKSVWNARDLLTGKNKLESFKEARSVFSEWLCQASFIKSPKDIDGSANAIIIGENLETFSTEYKKYD